MAFQFAEEEKRIVLNKNQEFLRDIDTLLWTKRDSPREVARLTAAREDVLSRLTEKEIAEYNSSRKTNTGFNAAQLAADLKEMELNKDKNSI